MKSSVSRPNKDTYLRITYSCLYEKFSMLRYYCASLGMWGSEWPTNLFFRIEKEKGTSEVNK